MKVRQEIKNIYENVHRSYLEKFELWKQDILFSWQWWVGVSLTLLPWILWVKYRKKESTHRLLYVAFFIMVVSIWLDSIGVQLGLWHYNYEVLPYSPSYKPWDLTLIPVLTIFFIQIKPFINPFFKGILYAGFIAFISEPIFVWSGFVVYTNWKYIYSFPIYLVIYLISHYLSTRNTFNKIHKEES
ncbi:CBO0543 family protein [Pseudalkalibacillus sp. A8]|uniref:CBO0543 family protein n=1 Tax=Pseudalkalibacillus sp. A8 TaxID=3382641 RepID=UPI0038B65F41